jgi:hypothetical protein
MLYCRCSLGHYAAYSLRMSVTRVGFGVDKPSCLLAALNRSNDQLHSHGYERKYSLSIYIGYRVHEIRPTTL